jgi:fatty acid desaturase
MFKASGVFTPEELLMLKRKSDWRGAWMIFHAWAVIFGAMALFVWWPNPLTFIAATVIIGARQLGLAILSHDAAHGLLFNNQRLNDFAGTWLVDYPLLGDMYAYRLYHVAGHHRFTQQKNDPDLALAAPFPITLSSFKRKAVRDLTGQTAYKQRAGLIRRAFGRPDMPWAERLGRGWKRLHAAIITNAIIFALLAASGHWWLYPALWIFPWMTFNAWITRIRSIAEHSMVTDNDDPFRNTRTTRANWFERAVVAPYFVNYHLEHHLLLAVPCYNLPLAHRMLLAKGYGKRMEIERGYISLLRRAASRPEQMPMSAAAA